MMKVFVYVSVILQFIGYISSIDRICMNDELDMEWNEATVAYSKVLLQFLYGRREDNQQKLVSIVSLQACDPNIFSS